MWSLTGQRLDILLHHGHGSSEKGLCYSIPRDASQSITIVRFRKNHGLYKTVVLYHAKSVLNITHYKSTRHSEDGYVQR